MSDPFNSLLESPASLLIDRAKFYNSGNYKNMERSYKDKFQTNLNLA